MKKLLLAFSCWLLAVGQTLADEKNTMFNPVEHAVISETIAPDARGAAMGDIGVATDPDVNSQHWNPAKYPFCISRAGVALNYTPWLRQLVNDIDLADPFSPTIQRYSPFVISKLSFCAITLLS